MDDIVNFGLKLRNDPSLTTNTKNYEFKYLEAEQVENVIHKVQSKLSFTIDAESIKSRVLADEYEHKIEEGQNGSHTFRCEDSERKSGKSMEGQISIKTPNDLSQRKSESEDEKNVNDCNENHIDNNNNNVDDNNSDDDEEDETFSPKFVKLHEEPSYDYCMDTQWSERDIFKQVQENSLEIVIPESVQGSSIDGRSQITSYENGDNLSSNLPFSRRDYETDDIDADTDADNIHKSGMLSRSSKKEFSLSQVLSYSDEDINEKDPEKIGTEENSEQEGNVIEEIIENDVYLINCSKSIELEEITSVQKPIEEANTFEKSNTLVLTSEQIAVFSKITTIQDEIITNLNKLEMRLLKPCVPESFLDRRKRERNAYEFTIRVARNYLYPLERMIKLLKESMTDDHVTKTPNNISVQVCGVYGLLNQALQSFENQIRHFHVDAGPQKLDILINMIIVTTKHCLKSQIFDAQDTLTKCLLKRCKSFMIFLMQLEENKKLPIDDIDINKRDKLKKNFSKLESSCSKNSTGKRSCVSLHSQSNKTGSYPKLRGKIGVKQKIRRKIPAASSEFQLQSTAEDVENGTAIETANLRLMRSTESSPEIITHNEIINIEKKNSQKNNLKISETLDRANNNNNNNNNSRHCSSNKIRSAIVATGAAKPTTKKITKSQKTSTTALGEKHTQTAPTLKRATSDRTKRGKSKASAKLRNSLPAAAEAEQTTTGRKVIKNAKSDVILDRALLPNSSLPVGESSSVTLQQNGIPISDNRAENEQKNKADRKETKKPTALIATTAGNSSNFKLNHSHNTQFIAVTGTDPPSPIKSARSLVNLNSQIDNTLNDNTTNNTTTTVNEGLLEPVVNRNFNKLREQRQNFLNECERNPFYKNQNYPQPWNVFSKISTKIATKIIGEFFDEINFGEEKFVEKFLALETQI